VFFYEAAALTARPQPSLFAVERLTKLAIGDIFRLDIVFKSDNSPYVAVCGPHFKQATLLVLDTPEEDLVGAFRDKAEPALLSTFTSTLRIVRYTVSPVPGTGSTYQLDLGITGPVGVRTGDRLPPRVATVLSFRSSHPGKRGRGRMYLPPASETDNTGGAPTADLLAACNNLGDAMLNDMPVADASFASWVWVIRSEADNISRDVISYVPRGYWGSQRDRTRIFPAG
jgi:hypothetical protein